MVLSYVSLRQDGIFITIEGRDSDIKEYLANGNGGLSDEEIENLLQYKKKDKMSVPVPPTPDNQWEIQLSPFLSYTEYTSIIQEQNEKYDAWLHDVVTELYEKDAESRIEKETSSAQTLFQIPVVSVYQHRKLSSFQRCFPLGWNLS